MPAISFTIIAWVSRGCPRQFRLMKENRRCSILFHLLVPGGKWQTVNSQARAVGKPLELPLPQPHSTTVAAAAVGDDQQRAACGYAGYPISFHQRRMVFTAKDAVS